ncbi:MAG TPA: tRNA (adenosine(37)-N6)-threonylcarbamoyltransferase complex ATPase subunit type 1 TsaE [Chlamydiales bacterium]|nr:tRNA (adenosine(37)-N6)-threonylcarbamoyltransferase complex ATPase subunit type 1 TsaE [Chlamydiales bacterium]
MSPDHTHRFGRHAAAFLLPHSILALFGPLGAGKTSFVQGLASGLNIKTLVQSPTFTYLHVFTEGILPLFHFDLYRMKNPADFFSMGFEEYFNQGGITVIEWPDRLGPLLPDRAYSFFFSYTDSGRRVNLSSSIDSKLIDFQSRV